MRSARPALALSAAAMLLSPVLAYAAPQAPDAQASLQPWLEQQLTQVAADAPLRVAVRGESLDGALAAAGAAGLTVQQEWSLVDTAVVVGTAEQVRALRSQPGVVHLEGDAPLAFTLSTAHDATRSNEALATYATSSGARVDGAGVSVAVIDSGVDGTHPMFQRDGKSTVAANLKNVCGATFGGTLPGNTCFQQVPGNDTDTISAGGHGTHVAGIAAGTEVTTSTPAGIELRGSAPGAHLVSLSVGAGLGLLDAMAAQNWVLEHQQNPCRSAAQQTASEVDADCPPIRVTNHSYGPAANGEKGNSFDEKSAAVQIQRKLVDKGVVAVWAAGNSGGDGSLAFTNPSGMDPTPGIVMVASYNDGGEGNRDNKLSTFSSRGKKGDQSTYPDLSAPGDRITSACRPYLAVCSTGRDFIDGGNYNTISGTSMAAPYVAGVVAQLFQADPTLTPGEVESILKLNAHPFAEGGAYETDIVAGGTTSFDKGHGLVDVFEALADVQPAAATTACTPRGAKGACAPGKGGKR
jgi:subtilisin family serine protease